MKTGDMRHFIRIERLKGTLNTSGNIDQNDWECYRASVRCAISDASGGEATRGDQVDATATHSIWTRYDPSITSEMRGVDHRNRILNFVSIIDKDGLEEYMTISARQQQ